MWAIWRPDALAMLKDKKAQASLARYFDVMRDDKPAKFVIAKKLPANFRKEDSLLKLWDIHDHLTEEFYHLEKEIDSRQKSLEELGNPERSYLDLKIEIANRILENCHLCTRRCGFNRLAGELGDCKCGTQITVSTMFEHMGEEPELVPSGTISQWIESGEIYSPVRLAKAVETLTWWVGSLRLGFSSGWKRSGT
ncbi:MAG: hypothetical protein AOA65_1391 [Candidatus Bathyarchaeota archaeon BA1]|nr:MAG: hypothetical protein AOA65_1391 [Candidatus Bathyarchaeota archaeon BA1]